MVVRVVEEIALDPPHLAEHLAPLGARIDRDLDGLELERTFAGLRRFVGAADEPFGLRLPEHLLALRREMELLHAVEHLLGLARLQVETLQRILRRTLAAARDLRPFHHINNAVFPGREPRVVPLRQRQRQNALTQSVKIDDHLRRGFFLLPGGIGRGLRVRGCVRLRGRLLRVGHFPVRVGFLPGVLVLRGPVLLFVALGCQRRREVLGQDREVDRARRRMADTAHVGPARAEADIGARGEIKIFAAAVEVR